MTFSLTKMESPVTLETWVDTWLVGARLLLRGREVSAVLVQLNTVWNDKPAEHAAVGCVIALRCAMGVLVLSNPKTLPGNKTAAEVDAFAKLAMGESGAGWLYCEDTTGRGSAVFDRDNTVRMTFRGDPAYFLPVAHTLMNDLRTDPSIRPTKGTPPSGGVMHAYAYEFDPSAFGPGPGGEA